MTNDNAEAMGVLNRITDQQFWDAEYHAQAQRILASQASQASWNVELAQRCGEWATAALNARRAAMQADATPTPKPEPKPPPAPAVPEPSPALDKAWDLSEDFADAPVPKLPNYLDTESANPDQMERITATVTKLADSSKRTTEDIKDNVVKPFLRALINAPRLERPPHPSYNLALPILESFSDRSPLDLLTKPESCGTHAKAGVDFFLKFFEARELSTKLQLLSAAIKKHPDYLPNLTDSLGDVTKSTDAQLIARLPQ